MAPSTFPILFVAPERPDDAILASGLVKRLADEVEHVRFVVAAGADVAPLFRELPALERMVVFEPGRFNWLKLWTQVRGRRWGLVLDLRGSPLAKFLHSRRKAVKKPPSAALEPVHKVVEAARVLKIDDDPPAPFLFVGPETEAAAGAFLRMSRNQGPILAVAPAADWVGKTWPAERFAVTAAELLGPNGPLSDGRLMLLGSSRDRWATETVRRATARDRLIDLVGKTDDLTAYAALRHARLFIGNETPWMHLAAGAGAPTLGLFGPSDERLYGPWGDKARALRGPRDFATLKALDPALNQALCHMQDLATAKVVAAARALLFATEPVAEAEGIEG